jgi:hypothetical protein
MTPTVAVPRALVERCVGTFGGILLTLGSEWVASRAIIVECATALRSCLDQPQEGAPGVTPTGAPDAMTADHAGTPSKEKPVAWLLTNQDGGRRVVLGADPGTPIADEEASPLYHFVNVPAAAPTPEPREGERESLADIINQSVPHINGEPDYDAPWETEAADAILAAGFTRSRADSGAATMQKCAACGSLWPASTRHICAEAPAPVVPPPSATYVEGSRERLAEIMATIPKPSCVHGVPFTRPEACADCAASDESDPLNVLDFCEGAIRDAISAEDGLDGAAGEGVLAMIRDSRARVATTKTAPPAGTAEPVATYVEGSRERLAEIMATIKPQTCLHGVPNVRAEACAECAASDESSPLAVLDFCEGAIRDAIWCEDGLDGAAGEAVLAMIRNARAYRAPLSVEPPPHGRILNEAEEAEAHELYTRLTQQGDPMALVRTIEHFRPWDNSHRLSVGQLTSPVASPAAGTAEPRELDVVSENDLGAWVEKVRDVVFYARVVARSKGYALGVHGTLRRDIDLVAVPWTDEACSADELAAAICDYLAVLDPPQAFAWADQGDDRRKAEDKPLGRKGYSLILRGHFIRPYIDLSVAPRAPLSAPAEGSVSEAMVKATVAEFKRKTAYWSPELLGSADHLEELAESMLRAALRVSGGAQE